MRTNHVKGLAATAVGALAISGLTAALPQSAEAAGSGVVLMSLFNARHDASLRYDGDDTGITLAAMRLDPAAAVTFEYNANPNATDSAPGWTAVPVPPAVSGDYSRVVWSPDPTLYGTSVAVRAVATVGAAATYSDRQGISISSPDSGPEALSLQGSVGFFDQPYASTSHTATHAAVIGYTSSTGGNAALSWWNPATRALQGTTNAQVEGFDLKVFTAPPPGSYVGGGVFHGDLDITAFDADAGDVIAIGGELDSDDVELQTLYVQQIGSISASAPAVAAGQPTTVTAVVDDTSSQPVAGAEVRRMTDDSLVGYTDGAGRVRDTQTSGALPDYYVNTTDNDAYEPAVDKTSTTSTYTPVADSEIGVSRDGRVFDNDEYAAGDVGIQLNDENNLPVGAGTAVSYRLYLTGTASPPAMQTATTDAQGRFAVPFSPQGTGGEYSLEFQVGSGISRVFRFVAGDSTLSLTPAAGAADPGGQLAFTGALKVAGRPLPGRRVGVTYHRGIELVPGKTADAGLVSGASRLLSLDLTTDMLGAVSFVVDDPAERPQGAEPGGTLTLATLAAGGGGTLTGNPAESAAGTTTFGTKKGKGKVKLHGSSAGSKDKLRVVGPTSLAGEKVRFYRVVGKKLKLIRSKKLGKKGDTTLKVADTNGHGKTVYLVTLVTSNRVKGSKSKKLTLE